MHNISVTNENKGTLIVVRTPADKQYTPSDFSPCEHCRGYYLRWDLWRHKKKCKFAPSKDKKRRNRAQRNSIILMESSKPNRKLADQGFFEQVISRMVVDSASMAARNDIIALKYGELKFSKFAKNKKKNLL